MIIKPVYNGCGFFHSCFLRNEKGMCCVVPRTSQYAESTREPRTLVASGKYNLFTELVHGIVITTDSIQSDWPNI